MDRLIDSHCHLTSDGLRQEAGAVIDRAAAVGVTEYVTIAEDLDDARQALTLSEQYPGVHVAAGIHPHRAGRASPGWDDALLEIVRRDDVFAVGETGLDYHYDYADRAVQEQVFRRQLALAADVGKPVVVHCREALGDALSILGQAPRLPGVVFHCFTGGDQEARAILDAGFWVSLPGVVTFKKSEALRTVVRTLPADRLMIETDAPYLSPEPVRRIRPNEPAHLVHTASCIARERGMELSEFAALTVENTRRFFSLPHE